MLTLILLAAVTVGSDGGRGVDPYGGGIGRGHARSHRDGTGCGNPAQGLLVREQQQRESAGTLVAPTQAGIKPGRPSSEPAEPLFVDHETLIPEVEPMPWQEWGIRDWEHEA